MLGGHAGAGSNPPGTLFRLGDEAGVQLSHIAIFDFALPEEVAEGYAVPYQLTPEPQ